MLVKYDYLKQFRDISDLADICYVRQKEQQGLGDAINCAKKTCLIVRHLQFLGDSITKDMFHIQNS